MQPVDKLTFNLKTMKQLKWLWDEKCDLNDTIFFYLKHSLNKY